MSTLFPPMAEKLADKPALGLRDGSGRLVAKARYIRTTATKPNCPFRSPTAIRAEGSEWRCSRAGSNAQADGVRTITADVLKSNDTTTRLLK
jgi:hypothetical protein